MGYIESGKKEGAKLHLGGERYGEEGYFIKPTIFTDTKPGMKIMREEIFGPVAILIKFESEEGSSSVVEFSCVLAISPELYSSDRRSHRRGERHLLWARV